MDKQFVVVDTNILFSALLSPSTRFAETILTTDEYIFMICESVVVELFEHKERIAQISRLPADELVTTYHDLLRHVTLYKETWITSANWRKAFQLCQDVDEDDTPQVALTLELSGLLWTGDRKLKSGLQDKGFTQFFEPSTIN